MTLVRFSSLGDVVLAGAIAKALGHVTFLTQPRYAGLVERFEGVERVLTDTAQVDQPVIDLHNNLRSRRLRATGRVRHHRWDRWMQVAWKRPRSVPTVLERYGRAAGIQPASAPWVPGWHPSAGRLGMAAGASVPTKVWPYYDRLAQLWEGSVLSVGLPGEGVRGTDQVLEEGWGPTVAAMARCSIFVGGDTGLTHLAHAMGIPTLFLFGPTQPQDGFWRGPHLSQSLPCQPCSRHGRSACPLMDHACMAELEATTVLRSLRELT